nr:TetR/AcrR family transcriptional regulator [Acinetobacter sp. Marseille-Q1620]
MRNKEFEPDEIANAAMHVFWEHGYAATSVQDLVDGTGLSRSSLYNTFENKQGLFQEALKCYQNITLTNVEHLSGQGHVKTLIRELLTSVMQDELSDPKQRGCLVANTALELAGHDENIAKQIQHNFLRLKTAYEKLIIRGQESGEISPDKNPEALANFFVNTMQGMRVLGKGCDQQQRKQCLSDVLETALQCL